MKKIANFALLIAAFLSACGPAAVPALAQPAATSMPPTVTPFPPTLTPEARTLTVFAAASLTDAFNEIGAGFEAANPGVSITFNFAGSSTLSTQLNQGAAADVFASANQAEMDKVIAGGRIKTDRSTVFLTNLLVVILPANNPANVQSLQDLARPGLKLVLGDKTLPAGKYALQILDAMAKEPALGIDFKTKVLANVVSYETDVKQVVAKVQLGEADAGVAYISDSVAAPDLKTIAIPAGLNVVAKYPIAPMINVVDPYRAQLASDFVKYVLSAESQAILKKWGFTPVVP
jgi:molybdate transport system substrate-binding protein